MPADHIAGVLLAAGAGKRFGADKLTAQLDGRTLLDRACGAMLDAGLHPVLAVVRSGFAGALPAGVLPVLNDRWRSGMASSVQAGLAALDGRPDVGAAVVAPADQPWCGAPVYRRLVDAFRDSGERVIVAAFDGELRNPVLVARDRWGLASGIEGDVGLSAVVRSLPPLVVECADVGSVADIDYPADLP